MSRDLVRDPAKWAKSRVYIFQVRNKITWIRINVPRIAIGGRSERGDHAEAN